MSDVARRVREVVTDALLWVLAALGLTAIVLVICAYVFSVSIILFRTGSMEPTIPAGSAAIVREIPAEEVAVGDVLTVERHGAMPVTHRVTSIAAGDAPGERVITMQGDANDSPDPAPYTITQGRVVLGSVPGIAPVINQMGSPYVMGGITLAASVLVGWAFWPRRTRREASQDQPKPRHSAGTVYVLGGLVAASLPVAALLSPTAAVAASEHNDDVVRETINSQYITLDSAYIPEQRLNMLPGDSARWDVTISASAPDPAVLRSGISMSGDFPLELTVTSCDRPWTAGPEVSGPAQELCAGSSSTLLEGAVIERDEEIMWLQEFSSEQAMWLRVDTVFPGDAAQQTAGTATVRVHASTPGNEATVSAMPESADRGQHDDGSEAGQRPGESSPEGALAQTGFGWAALILLATIVILLGRTLYVRAHQSGIQSAEESS